MNTVCDKNQCTGCMACVDVCPKHAVKINDSRVAMNAYIDEKLCVGCNLCHNICNVNHLPQLHHPVHCFEGWAVSSEIRSKSSSGGLATAIEAAFIRQGGYVCSCVFDDGAFKFKIINDETQVGAFTGSKYVKSNPGGCYRKLRDILSDNKKILFVGLPCQVAGVKNYVGENHTENLYTIDLICHGTPSSELFESFLSQYEIEMKRCSRIDFRVKNNFLVSCNQKKLASQGQQDPYTMAFLNSISYTENCYNCKYAQINRVSDITLGDSWDYDSLKDEHAKGLSLVLCQTDKGKELLDNTELVLHNANLDVAVKTNHQLEHPSIKPKQRDKFFAYISKEVPFNNALSRCMPISTLKQRVKGVLAKLNILR